MASATMEPRIGRVDEEEEEEQQHDRVDGDGDSGVMAREVSKRVSRLAVAGGQADDKAGHERGAYKIGGGGGVRSAKLEDSDVVHGRRSAGGRTLPPPHAWLAIEDTKKHYDSDPEEKWMRLLRGGSSAGAGTGRQQRRSSFSVVRRERAAREACLDRAWEMKRNWHERNGGAPDADTPVVVVVGKGPASPSSQAGAVGGGGVAMDMEEVRACRDLGLELPSDCTVEIQCYGLSGGGSPTHTASSGADTPCDISSPGVDPMDVKARLKVWAQAVALASTTHLGS
ncbi:uncharacterized protein LOC133928405 isoform X2 [Phragmites australis]|uniref:uncharacterized protein LOC133928405 isoform X2 n=1 Tax=Phragmites australis TaxID=29695 RepID=UPI002D796D3B|nr:uncharacterized protein LOC133928405 isoform X2 [Phragmites australis]